jgi:20S proteasome alpha/beta subunit
MISPKPLVPYFHPVHFPPAKRPRKRGEIMTLAAAFRGPNGGILLCSDQEWNDAGVSKRQMNKNYRISGLRSCDVFIAGAGLDTAIIKACAEIHKTLVQSENNGTDILIEHETLFREQLQQIYVDFSDGLKEWGMYLLIVIAPRSANNAPMLYRTDGHILVPEPYYYSVGSGKPVADYLADRLYEPGRLRKRELVTLAAFISREAGESSIGVGLGANMVFIHEGDKAMHFMGPGAVKQMQDGIPSLKDAIQSYWPGKINSPDWMGS